MTRQHKSFKTLFLIVATLIFAAQQLAALSGPTAQARSDFDAYVSSVEARLTRQHQAEAGFIAAEGPGQQSSERLRRGESIVEQLNSPTDDMIPGALLHHWRGTAFAPGAKALDFERLIRGFNAYPRIFAPEVLQASVQMEQGDHMQATMRVRQQHVITVVLDTAYDIRFGRLDATHGFSTVRSTRISEIASPGTAAEHALSPEAEHGFIWRTNTYWSYEERDGGLYIQVESISLTRSVPRGLGWAVGPFIESVPRESLEFTLRSTCNALRK
jgi:hypothetical protein